MGSRRQKSEFEKVCFCLGLRQSIIIASALWLVEGGVMAALMLMAYLSNSDGAKNIFERSKTLSIILFLHFTFLAVLGIFGLGSLIYKSTQFMQTYKSLAWVFAASLNAVMGVVTLVLIILDQINLCTGDKIPGENASICRENANSVIVWACIAILFQCTVHLYFTIILRNYVRLRVDKEKVEERSKLKKSISPSKVSKILLKVDKTYDMSYS